MMCPNSRVEITLKSKIINWRQSYSLALLYPEFDASKTRKASLTSSSEIIGNTTIFFQWAFGLHFPIFVSFIFLEMRVRNSRKSISPLPSTSTSLIISDSSAGVWFWPRELSTVPSSRVLQQTLTMGSHGKDSREISMSSLLSWFPDGAVSVFIKQSEGLSELCRLLLRQKLGHDWLRICKKFAGKMSEGKISIHLFAPACSLPPLWSLNNNIYIPGSQSVSQSVSQVLKQDRALKSVQISTK